MALYLDRTHAGRALAQSLSQYAGRPDVVVLALPRGGVPVGFEIARELNIPLDVFLVRKLGVPGQEELALGAIASGGIQVLNEELVHYLNITEQEIGRIAAVQIQELERREQLYRAGRPLPQIEGNVVILVDDGLATGASMRAAVQAIRALRPAKVVVAVPVAAREICEQFKLVADDVICPETPEPFFGVGAWYDNFDQLSDEEVRDYLERSTVFSHAR